MSKGDDEKDLIDSKYKFQVVEKYNSTALEYSKNHESRFFWLQLPYKRCFEILSKKEIKYVIDFGCGSGVLLSNLANEFPNVNFIGIDFSKELISIAKENNNSENLTFYIQDFCTINNCEWFRTIEKNSVFYILSGPLEYYSAKDEFPQIMKSIWVKSVNSAIYLTFHNVNFFLRKWFYNKDKKYWKLKDAIDFFKEKEITYRYFCFFPIDYILSKIQIMDKVLFTADILFSKLPSLFTKKMCMNFELVIYKL